MDGCFYDISVVLVLFICTCSRSSYQATQKQVALMVVVVLDAGGKNSIDMNPFYNIHQSSLGSNNLRDMLLSLLIMINVTLIQDFEKKDTGVTLTILTLRNYTCNIG